MILFIGFITSKIHFEINIVWVKQAELMKLKIRVLDQDDFNVEVPNNASIDTLSKTIAENSNMPTNQQRLIFRGQLMQPGSLLSDYGVEDGCVIHMVKRNTVFHKIYSI